MKDIKGAYEARKKDGTIYYRSSISFHNRQISLGGYETREDAGRAYEEARQIIEEKEQLLPEDYPEDAVLPFQKWVVLLNFHNNHIYIKTPIYLKERYFLYYLSRHDVLTFDADDLFYYSTHSIMRRGGHLFVSDYGMQVNILSRYGIKNFAVPGRDYRFANGNEKDYRYENIIIINHYHGVLRQNSLSPSGSPVFLVKIHICGDTIVGKYPSEELAAIAYNKAAKTLQKNGCKKNFPLNYLENLSTAKYLELYETIDIADRIKQMTFPT